jgi:hypothetical protein
VTVRAHDNGGAGEDTSPPQVFTIAVASFAEEIGVYNGLVTPAPSTTREFARFGLLRGVVSRKGGLSASLVLGGRTYPIKGDVLADGSVRFGKTSTPTMPLVRPGLATLTLALTLEMAAGTDVLHGTISDGNSAFALVSADRAGYDAKLHPAPPAIARKYTAASLRARRRRSASVHQPFRRGMASVSRRCSRVAR